MNKKFIAFVAAAIALTSCQEPTPTPIDGTPEKVVSGLITSDATWSSDSIIVLQGRVVVDNGVTLNIDAGTIIKGKEGDGANASCLIVAQGGKLNAMGTAASPIVMTSVLDNIEVGQKWGTNLDETDKGLWGGLIVLGNAPISADASTALIEGLPANEPWAVYGGSNSSDNSGSLNYISIRHGGTLIGDGNEINGLTLAGVGSATTVNNIEVVGNIDDGVEFFGGAVNVSDILVWAQGDDAVDVDQAYSGTVNNFMYIAGSDSDHGLEIDGPEGTLGGICTLQNGTLIGLAAEMGDFRDSAMANVSNLFFTGFTDGGDLELDDTGSANNYTAGLLTFSNIEVDLSMYVTVPALTDIFVDKSGLDAMPTADFVTDVTGGAATVGADQSKFTWTYASYRGAF